MTKIYTKTGDAGETGLFGGERVSKNDLRIEAIGVVDELSAAMGVAGSQEEAKPYHELISHIQRDLFAIGAELASSSNVVVGLTLISATDVERLEREIDKLEISLPPLKHFILPGGSPIGASLHFARTVCRRAERAVVRLYRHASLRPELLKYVNRLSDLLFMLARHANFSESIVETSWRGRS
ncbi:MAG: cob(I)yrinic acid a,c-diamide adenosyltransferase [Parcubacteria group bacterium]|nr:cob(I)yrinic acid a,c-diamide adenosyltransferase [Parcubacteria group bacterium]